MSIDDGFRKMLAGVKQADEGRDEIMRGLEAAWAGRVSLEEQIADLRDTVSQLQQLVMEQSRTIHEQSQQIAALRERLNGGAR